MKILTLIAVVVFGFTQQPTETPKGNGTPKPHGAQVTNNADTGKGNKQSSAESTSPYSSITIVFNNQPDSQSRDHETKKADNNAAEQDLEIQRELTLFTGLLVVVGFLQFLALLGTLGVVGLQAKLMGTHAEHLATVASAASLNAKALINAERPWVMVQTEVMMGDDPRKTEFKLSAFNYGKSPAHITACRGPKIQVMDSNQSLPVPPIYGDWEWDNTFLAPQDSIPLRDAVNPWEAYKATLNQAIAEHTPMPKNNYVVVYGVIEYGDGISRQAYKTAYCYTLKRDKPSHMGGTLIRYGPPEYNAYT